MPYRDGTTGGLDALRKHREKRRANAVLSISCNKQFTNRSQLLHPDSDGGTAYESPSFRTEGSSQDVLSTTAEEESNYDKNSSSNEFFKTIVTTSLDREKMRKISMLGFDDPVDRASMRRENSKGDNGLIIATEESIETMRKISKLGLEDPVDLAPDSPVRRGLKQRRAAGTGQTIHVQRYRDSARYAGVELSELREMSRGAFRASPCTSHLQGASACFPSIDPNCPLGGSSRTPVKRERKARRRSLDLDYPVVLGLTEGVSFCPVQVTTTGGESVPRDHSRCPIFGVVEAPKEKRQLMRMVSVLGMQDPVFGDIQEGTEARQEPAVDEDMDGVQESYSAHLQRVSTGFPSIDLNSPLGGSSLSPLKRERKARRGSLDLDYPVVLGLTEGVSFPPIQGTTTGDESVPRDRSRCPIVFGVVEATEEKQQLMRMVSVLGMQDPVFGDIQEGAEARQEPTVDETMMDGVEGPVDTKGYTAYSAHLQGASAGFPSIDLHSPLGGSSRSPLKRERKARRRSLDLDYPVVLGLTEGVSFPPIQGTTTGDESVPRDRSRCPIVFGVVEAPKEKQQLMRMVSVQDPVFGDIQEGTEARQEPTVDETMMDGVEGPADTKEYTAYSAHLQGASAGFPSIDLNSPLGCSSRSPLKRERKARRCSLDLDYPVVLGLTEGVSFPPIQGTTTGDESVPRDRSRCPIVFGVVEATEEKQQLMRMVSFLGMQDPVFGDIQEDMENFQHPVVDEMMDGVKVTTNTVGHLAHATEASDTGKIHLHLATESEGHEVGFEQDSLVDSYEPPGGSFNRRASQKRVHGVMPVVISPSPPVPKGRKSVVGGPLQQSQNESEDLRYAPPAGHCLRRMSARPDHGISPPAVTPSPPMPKGRKSVTKGSFHRPQKDLEDGGCVQPPEAYALGRRESVKSGHPSPLPDFSPSPPPTTSRKCTYSGSSKLLEKDKDELMSSSSRHSSTGFVPRDVALNARNANGRSSTPTLEASLKDFELVHMVPEFPPSPPSTRSKKSATGGSFRLLDKDNDELMNSSSLHSVKDLVPPNGAFNARKPNERSSTPTRDMLLKDMELAHMVQSIFHNDNLLAESACSLHQSMSELNASFGCINFDEHENI